jgi:hypothetical protein
MPAVQSMHVPGPRLLVTAQWQAACARPHTATVEWHGMVGLQQLPIFCSGAAAVVVRSFLCASKCCYAVQFLKAHG